MIWQRMHPQGPPAQEHKLGETSVRQRAGKEEGRETEGQRSEGRPTTPFFKKISSKS
jgi:hypothetical protein